LYLYLFEPDEDFEEEKCGQYTWDCSQHLPVSCWENGYTELVIRKEERAARGQEMEY
jgi:hypothetical protein